MGPVSGTFLRLFIYLLLLRGHFGSATLCTNIPAGLRRMSLGVDVTQLTLHPLDFTQPDGFAHPVIDFTCDQGKTWINPYDEKTYQIPDQVEGIVSVPGGWDNIVTLVFRTYKEVKIEMSSYGGLSFLKGLFSVSANYKRMSHAITNKTMVISDVYSFVSTTEGIFAPSFYLGLNKYGQLFLDRLPDSFSENPQLYYSFISNFGTHYFSKARFGGYLRNYFETNSDYYSQTTVTDLRRQAKASFFKRLMGKGKVSHLGTVTTVDEKFTQNTYSLFMNYGGDTNAFEESGLAGWQATVQSNPWLFGGSLVPIYDMINDTTKKESMERAVQAHMDKAFLEELQSLLRSVEHKPGLKYLEEKLEKEMRKVIPDDNIVEELGKEIENVLITPPAWWLGVRFCVYGYVYVHGHLRGPYGVCSGLGAFTQSPWNDNSWAGEVHQIRYGVFADTSDAWFSQVQLCMKYRAGPDADSNQCNSGIDLAELCAPVNSYTPYYYDRTDDRPGGCLISWQLRAPPESPQWLLKTQFCFKWEEGNGHNTRECGVGSENMLCAFVNEWTPEYLDDTDSRSDYCKFQWSITDSRLFKEESMQTREFS